MGRYGSVKHPSEVTVHANTEIVAPHRHYGAILIVINFIIYKLRIFSQPSGFELGSLNLIRKVASYLGHRGSMKNTVKKYFLNNNNT